MLGRVGAAFGWRPAARGEQPKLPMVGVVSISGALSAIWRPPFLAGLEAHGWIPDRTLSIEYCFADNMPSGLQALVRNLVRLKPDAIFVPTRPAVPSVKEAAGTIPIVFVSLGDPLAEGWVSSIAKPGGNLTGVAGLSLALVGKRLELLRELVPSLTRLALLRDPANRAEEVAVGDTVTEARKLGMSIDVVSVSEPDRIDDAIAGVAADRAEAIIVTPDPMFNEHRAMHRDLRPERNAQMPRLRAHRAATILRTVPEHRPQTPLRCALSVRPPKNARQEMTGDHAGQARSEELGGNRGWRVA